MIQPMLKDKCLVYEFDPDEIAFIPRIQQWINKGGKHYQLDELIPRIVNEKDKLVARLIFKEIVPTEAKA